MHLYIDEPFLLYSETLDLDPFVKVNDIDRQTIHDFLATRYHQSIFLIRSVFSSIFGTYFDISQYFIAFLSKSRFLTIGFRATIYLLPVFSFYTIIVTIVDSL